MKFENTNLEFDVNINRVMVMNDTIIFAQICGRCMRRKLLKTNWHVSLDAAHTFSLLCTSQGTDQPVLMNSYLLSYSWSSIPVHSIYTLMSSK